MQSYITEPFVAIQTMIDASKPKLERIHAALGFVDFGIIQYGPLVGLRAAPDKTDAELCASIKACTCHEDAGMKGIDWAAVWKDVEPLALQLLQRLLFGGL